MLLDFFTIKLASRTLQYYLRSEIVYLSRGTELGSFVQQVAIPKREIFPSVSKETDFNTRLISNNNKGEVGCTIYLLEL